MNKLEELFKNKKVLFYAINIFIILYLIIPKSISTVLNIIPVRLFLSCILIGIYFLDSFYNKDSYKKINKIALVIYSIFLVFCIPSIFVSKNFISSIYTLIKFITTFVLFEMCFSKKFTKDEYTKIVKTTIISLLFVILYGFLQYIFNFGLQTIGIEKYLPAKGRVVSTFFNTIYFGLFINIIISYLFNLKLKSNSKLYKTILSIIIILCYVSIVLTFTRSSFLVFWGIMFLLLLINYKSIINFSSVLILTMCLVLTFVIPGGYKLITESIGNAEILFFENNIFKEFLPNFDKNENNVSNNDSTEQSNTEQNTKPVEKPNDKPNNTPNTKPTTKPNNQLTKPNNGDNNSNNDNNNENTQTFDDFSLEHRKDFAVLANSIASNNKLTGVGFGAYLDYLNSEEFSLNYSYYTGDKTHPHSALVLLNVEVGIIATIMFIIFYLYLFAYSFKEIIWNFRKENYFLASSLFCTFIGFGLVNIIAENAIYDSQIFSLFLIIVGLTFNYLNDTKDKKILFISSTGGHLNEMLSLKELFKKYDYHIVTEKTKSTLSLKNKYKKVDYLIPGSKDHKFSYIFKFTYNFLKSIYLYIKIRPNYILTTGTHTAVPMCYIGKCFGTKVIFIETFANITTKTLSGKLVYPIADLFLVQWEEMTKLYPKAEYGGWIY